MQRDVPRVNCIQVFDSVQTLACISYFFQVAVHKSVRLLIQVDKNEQKFTTFIEPILFHNKNLLQFFATFYMVASVLKNH